VAHPAAATGHTTTTSQHQECEEDQPGNRENCLQVHDNLSSFIELVLSGGPTPSELRLYKRVLKKFEIRYIAF
jgi:hypothetical protein